MYYTRRSGNTGRQDRTHRQGQSRDTYTVERSEGNIESDSEDSCQKEENEGNEEGAETALRSRGDETDRRGVQRALCSAYYEGGPYIRSAEFVYPWITSFLSCSAACYR